MKKIVDTFSDASKKFSLKINTKNTEVLYQPNSTRTWGQVIMVDRNNLDSVPEFTYIGHTLSSNGCIAAEIQRRMVNASRSFGRLRQILWNNYHISSPVKVTIYYEMLLTTLFYEAETWIIYKRRVKSCMLSWCDIMRSIMDSTWKDKVPNKKYVIGQGCPLWKIFW